MMRLLVITNNLNHASFRQRVVIHLDLLRNNGIDCQVAKLPRGLLERRSLFASARHFDGVLLHRKVLNLWDGFWLRRCARPVIYDIDDAVMYDDLRSGRDSRIRLRRFAGSVAASRLVIAGNDYLAEHARRYGHNVRVLPTGLDIREYRTPERTENDGKVRLVWIGGRSTLKYLGEIRPALEELGRRFQKVILRVICDTFFDLEAIPVEKRPWSRQTEAADLISSDIGLAPLPDNAFTRGKCGFKILQYQAAGLPVVASPVGVNGQYVQDSVTGFLARDRAQWIDRLGMLIEDPGLRTALGRSGQQHVEGFDVRVIGEHLSRLVMETLGQNRGAGPDLGRHDGAANQN
jgi:glycosyltransferase involved in cell wall biosynthesis